MEIQFDEDLHQYTIDGRILPSVTQAIKGAGLIDDQWFTEETRERGQAVHLACQFLDDADLVWNTLEDEYRPYVEAYEKFLLECAPTWDYTEHKVFDETWLYAGRLDRAGEMLGHYAVLDIKTGSMPKWCALQLAGYCAAMNLPHARRYGLQLKKDGSYKLHHYKDKNDLKVFRAVLAVANWRKNHGIS